MYVVRWQTIYKFLSKSGNTFFVGKKKEKKRKLKRLKLFVLTFSK